MASVDFNGLFYCFFQELFVFLSSCFFHIQFALIKNEPDVLNHLSCEFVCSFWRYQNTFSIGFNRRDKNLTSRKVTPNILVSYIVVTDKAVINIYASISNFEFQVCAKLICYMHMCCISQGFYQKFGFFY